jgi:FkbM family methyltransferase
MTGISNRTTDVSFETIKHALVALQNALMFELVLWGNRQDLGKVSMVRLGSPYGGWWVPIDAETNFQSRTLVSAGLGFDTSFDEAMLERGWSVLGIDPLKECCAVATERLGNFPNIEILNVGLSVEDGYQTFFEPKNPNHDSWSTINAQAVVNPLTKIFPVISLGGLIKNHKIVSDAQYRYLKMDIEGAELALLQESLKELIDFDFLAIELDFLALIPFRQISLRLRRVKEMRKILRKLKHSGWDLIQVENSNFFWRAT